MNHARAWTASHPGHTTVVVLVTDAFPTECTTGPAALVAVSDAAFAGEPSVPVYVVGVGGTRLNMDGVALSGGTGEAMVMGDSSLAEDFETALESIVASRSGCEFDLPDPAGAQPLDLRVVSMRFMPSGTDETREIPLLPDASACATASQGGWYFVGDPSPATIAVCPCTCQQFEGITPEFVLGCTPRGGGSFPLVPPPVSSRPSWWPSSPPSWRASSVPVP